MAKPNSPTHKMFALATSLIAASLAAASLTFAQQTPPAPTPAAPAASLPAAKTLIDYFLPTPIQNPLVKNVWGDPGVLPRDAQNGLEDHNMMKDWCYWDGQIIKAKDGKYHMFASRWDQSKGHGGWGGSVAVHAVSDTLLGPYVDKGLCWPDNQNGKGHNVTAVTLTDGTYAIVVSDTRPGEVFVAKSLDGPWEYKGKMAGVQPTNISIMVRPDGDFEAVPRNGIVYIAKAADGILGPYKAMGASVYPKGIPNLEDPVVWFSGGLYHITVNSFSTRKAYHLTSKDGINDWTNRGLAYDPTTNFIRYPDGTVNHWNNLERPGVYIEDGHIKAFTLAAIDVPKGNEKGNDIHGSKVLVIPFDGVAFDRDLQAAAAK